MNCLINNLLIITMNNNEIINQGYIIIQDNIIQTVGTGEAPQGQYEKIIDGKGKVAMPGLINAHTHAAMTLLRGYGDDLPLMEWLEKKIWPLEAKLTAEDIYWGTKLAIVEMIKSGTTCFADMYFFMDQVAQVVEETGMRAVLARGLIGVGPEHQTGLDESRSFVQKYNGAGQGRIKTILGPHAPYTCPPEYLHKVLNLADELGVGIHIHLAETAGEVADISKTYGVRPVEYLEKAGVFNFPVLAAHCVHLSDEEIEKLNNYKVGVAHNPESNMKLASGIAPVEKMLKAGISVALGTDGASSNNDLDMLQEMRTASFLQKVHLMDPTVLPAAQVLEMGTINGARALGLEKEVGLLAPGYKADLILISLESANMIPNYNVEANLVYSAQAGDVDTVIIDGQIIMENRIIKTFSEEETLFEAQRIAAKLIRK